MDVVDEARLAGLALTATAAQLAQNDVWVPVRRRHANQAADQTAGGLA